MDTDHEVNRTRHQMKVPGLGVLIAPKAVGRLFTLHDYRKCPQFIKKPRSPRVLYPILRPNVYNCPRMYHLRQAARLKRRFSVNA